MLHTKPCESKCCRNKIWGRGKRLALRPCLSGNHALTLSHLQMPVLQELCAGCPDQASPGGLTPTRTLLCSSSLQFGYQQWVRLDLIDCLNLRFRGWVTSSAKASFVSCNLRCLVCFGRPAFGCRLASKYLKLSCRRCSLLDFLAIRLRGDREFLKVFVVHFSGN